MHRASSSAFGRSSSLASSALGARGPYRPLSSSSSTFARSQPASSIPLHRLRTSASASSSAVPSLAGRTTAVLSARSSIPWARSPSGAPLIRATSPYLLLSRSFATPTPGGDSAKEAQELKAALSNSSAAQLAPQALDKTAKEVAAASDGSGKAPSKEDDKKKLTAWEKVKKEAKHYWHGTKLLGKEIRISAKLQRKVLNGGTLTRREQRQLKRTTTDLLRLIPFSVFVIIPGLELLLPVFLRFFPNMLPSTFEDKFAAEEKQRKLLKVRIGVAKFLQETISESGLKANEVVKSDEFKQFFRKVRSTGESPSKEDIVRVAKLFESDVTLDNLSRPQLVSMCRYMKIHAFGTDNFLRHQIRSRLEKIRADDKVILSEGVQSLSVPELQQACQSRGIRFTGVSPSGLRRELANWIELHYTNKVSGVLLVLSRAFHFNEASADVIKSLEVTLSSLPDKLLSEAELDVLGEEATYQEKLEVLQQQQELIEDEAEQEQEEELARREKKELDDRLKAEEKARRDEERRLQEQERDDAMALLPEAEFKEVEEPHESEDGTMSKEQLAELAEALTVLSAKSSIVKEREELKALMQDNIKSEQESKLHPEDHDKVETSLSKRIRSMITKIDTQLEAYDAKVGGSLKMIDVHDGKISVADLEKALQVIKHKPEQENVHTILDKLDSDHDGFVVLDDVVALTQETGLGIVVDEEANHLLDQGASVRDQGQQTIDNRA